MECAICHRDLVISSPDRDLRVAQVEDGVALCRRCVAEVNRDAGDDDAGPTVESPQLPRAA